MQKLSIKLIQVDGSYKALVLDLSKETNRLVEYFESNDKGTAYNDAAMFIAMFQGSNLSH
jgi:hypothetical protein